MKLNLTILFLTVSLGLHAQEEAQKAFSEGVRQLKAQNFIEAENLFSIAIEKGETENGLKMSYIYKGFSLNGQGKYDDAIVCFDRAIEIDSLDPASFTDRALAHSYKNDYLSAIKDFEHVLTLNATSEQAEAAYFYLGKIKMLTSEDEAAIPYFDKLIELVPTDAEAYFIRGTAKSNIMDSNGAIADFDKAIELRPNYMEAYANRGVQKINKLPVEQKTGDNIECIEDPCSDLLKAKELGDTSVEDMIFLYCKKCK
ncbi:MAG: tetratricopeptide repeat protein [Flavobacteriales bacterium]